MKNILFIHQSAELYGSDKTLLLLLKNIDKTRFFPVVILPNVGPLKIELEKENIKVVIAPVLKLYRKMFSPKNIFTFIKDIKNGLKIAYTLHKEHNFEVVYSNTLAVLLGFFFAKKRKIKHIWHVHEIIESPKIFSSLFRKILDNKSVSKVIYNSKATSDFWNSKNWISNKSSIVYNGLELPTSIFTDENKTAFRKDYFKANDNDVVIALVGRVSRWKGQLILLDTFTNLQKFFSNIKLVFVGSPPPNQENFLNDLKTKINEFGVSDLVTLIPFQENINDVWQSIDIAVVPSIEPEPFGLVAVEAMMCKKPVVASNHGGLSEIIINDKTGFLVEPNNEESLKFALETLIKNPELRNEMGKNGYKRALEEFSVGKYATSIQELF